MFTAARPWPRSPADTKYYLYVNGQLVVFEGGLNRGPVPGGAYGDRIDLSPYLKQGENVIAALVWYWGNGGRNNVDGGCPGFYFAMDEGETPAFKGILHPAYGSTEPPWPAYLYGGHNIGYDARRDIGDFTAPGFDDSQWPAAMEVAGAPLYARPVPLVRAGEPREYAGLCPPAGPHSGPLALWCTDYPLLYRTRAGRLRHLRVD